MSLLTLYTRSFHPDKNFGLGGIGFHGDDRDFSPLPRASARIHHVQPIDLRAARLLPAICWSDPSHNDTLTTAGGLADDVAEQVLRTPIDIPDLPPFETDYNADWQQPRHEEEDNISPYREDGNQTVDMVVKYAGKNFAFPFNDTAFGRGVYGGPRSNEAADDTGGTSNSPLDWNGVVPDLDVTHRLTIQIDRANRRASVMSTIAGDGFPNCESFLYDASDGLLMLATFVRTGTAITQLPGGRMVQMTHSEFTVDWNEGDLFGESVDVDAATDFNSFGRLTIAEEGVMTRAEWSRAHLGRNASGNLVRQYRDHFPTWQARWPSRDELLNLETDHESPASGWPSLSRY